MEELLEEIRRNSNNIKFDPPLTDHLKMIELNNKLYYILLLY